MESTETLVEVSPDSSPVWIEVLRVCQRRSNASHRDRNILGSSGICRDSGLRHDRDRVVDKRKPSVWKESGVNRQSTAWPGGAAVRYRGGDGSRGQHFPGVLERIRASGAIEW